MVTMTLAVPDDLKQKMDAFPEMNWSAVAREAFKKRIELLEKFREFTRDSALSDKEAEEIGLQIGRKVNKAVSKKYLKNVK